MSDDLNSLPLPALFKALAADGCVDRLIDAALAEDHGQAGDITSESMQWDRVAVTAVVTSREPGMVSGLAALPRLLTRAGLPAGALRPLIPDGVACSPGQSVAELNTDRTTLLGIERIALNLLGRLSGIATLTRQFVDAVSGTNAVICDTRKTTPGLRNLEKYAVRCGGGTLHRLGLFDAALYKDNHLAGVPLAQLAGVVASAAIRARDQLNARFVQVEVDSLDQLKEVLGITPGIVDMILLDNMNIDHLRAAVAMRDRTGSAVLLEASGGVRLDTVRAIAETGVDRISVGAITHAAHSLDFGLDIP